ncbi:cysteine synthase A [Mycoplasmatota bacterium WC30]
MGLYNNILETIGNTPLVRLKNVELKYNLKSRIYAKLESFNPSNSVKTRPAYYMLKDLRDRLVINDGSVIVEATSGNTGIALAMISAYFGYKCILVMPDSLSKERIDYMRLYGAEIVLTPGSLGMKGSQAKAKAIQSITNNAVIPSQFTNPMNPHAHYQTTGPEIVRDLNSKIDYLIAGIGTGGTITGLNKYFKELGLKTKIIGVEPINSSIISGNAPGKHKIQGIGAGFIPEILDPNILDEILTVNDETANEMTRECPKLEGISVGISSGAVLKATIEYIVNNNLSNKDIVMIFPDAGEKYFSTGIFE